MVSELLLIKICKENSVIRTPQKIVKENRGELSAPLPHDSGLQHGDDVVGQPVQIQGGRELKKIYDLSNVMKDSRTGFKEWRGGASYT